MDWTEVKLEIGTGAVEAVANFIHESGAGGVVIEHLDRERSAVTAYIPAGGESEAFLARLEAFCAGLSQLDLEADAAISTRIVMEKDWEEEWKRHYHPVSVGNVYITPSWLPRPSEPGRVVIQLDPGMAFGTGSHPTTQMCIAAISRYLQAGDTVLDLGAGSGILSIAAAKLGAGSVDAVDYDQVAVRVASENARRNNCSVSIRQGDAFAALRESGHQLVVANIGYNACAKLAKIFKEEGKVGTLILSGFPQERLSEFEQETALTPIERMTQGDWACLVLRN
ncbi:MAG: 50S ribosomal protein L11 methyltransferase [Bacillota bacterium]|jgi:ribosomal protein L11 methyltransferase